ncbi:hypothetical protein Tsubulata_048430 [Turnera subulata]|uniref:Uncharacterized protein n=1 Tax=Turnera subulata TaxID=218843 RepID=A0A9Q0GJM7_9ROSI|nr:hypothetical protein Tsubulata_048430 [Turnera subulata]
MGTYFKFLSLQATLFAIFILSTTNFSSTTATATTTPPFKKIYAFGDSFTDTGNTKSATGPTGFGHVSNPPYGSTFFHHPTNRYSDGRLVIDFVAEALALPYLPPYPKNKRNATHGLNFAFAGSTAINHAFFVNNNLTLDVTPQSIQTQLIWFNKFLESQGCKGTVSSSSQCKALLDDALIWVGEIGVNDYAYSVGSSISSDTIRKLAISSVIQFLQAILKKGVKHVVIQGLPPTGCLPLSMSLTSEDDRDDMGCAKSVNNQSGTHNAMYQARLQEIRTQFPDATITHLDYWNAYRSVVKNPEAYGFKEPFKACCGSGTPPYNFDVFTVCGMPSASACPNPSQYINWDGVHLTEAMYKALFHMFVNDTFSQPPLGQLLGMKQNGR